MAIEMNMTGIRVATEGLKVSINTGGAHVEGWTFTPNQARIIALAINAAADEVEEA